ncbi:MAG: penicillin-binding protein 2 [Thermoanaerobaculia bacterium]
MPSSAREDRRPLLRRIDRLAVGAFSLLALLLGIYWVHQVLRRDEYARQAENNRQRSVPISASRGFILDRNGRLLAENEPSFTLLLYKRETKDVDASLRFVSGLLGRPLDDLRRRLERSRTSYDFVPVDLDDDLSVAEVGAVEAHALEHPELVVQTTERRVYKQGATLAHLLGHLGEATPEQLAARAGRVRSGEAIGQKGVEAAYQDLLAGTSGLRTFVIDSFGREVAELDRVDPLPGNTLVLNVDLDLQEIADDYFKDKVGTAVALDPKTGEILALVSAPAFDPNVFSRRVSRTEWDAIVGNEDHPLQNRAIQNVYSPGSVWKAFVAYAALTHGISPTERVHCPGSATFYGRTFRCHSTHGDVDLPTALQVSCDTYFYTMGKRLGIEALAETARLFGFGRPTGVDLASEKAGTVPSPEWSLAVRKHPWYPGETISVAIGQGPVLVSALQTARAFSAIANADGGLPVPHLFRIGEHVRSGSRVAYRPPVTERVAWPAGTREIVLDGLWRVVNRPGGTGYAHRVEGLDICGKTGTVQVVAQKEAKKTLLLPEKLRDHAWFAGFAPRDDPKIVVVVFVENGLHGASAAAPLAMKLVEAYLRPGSVPIPTPATAPLPEATPPGGSTTARHDAVAPAPRRGT